MDQPRVPAGTPKGGQWTSGTGTGGQYMVAAPGKAVPTATVVRKTTMQPGEAIIKHSQGLADAAQKVYDDWKQDEEGFDEELGEGGICQDIAEGMADVLNSKGIEAATVSAEIGEQHVWVVAKAEDGVFIVDIPPGVYETGGGYTWRKRSGVIFTPDHLIVDRLSPDPEDFGKYIGSDE